MSCPSGFQCWPPVIRKAHETNASKCTIWAVNNNYIKLILLCFLVSLLKYTWCRDTLPTVTQFFLFKKICLCLIKKTYKLNQINQIQTYTKCNKYAFTNWYYLQMFSPCFSVHEAAIVGHLKKILQFLHMVQLIHYNIPFHISADPNPTNWI